LNLVIIIDESIIYISMMVYGGHMAISNINRIKLLVSCLLHFAIWQGWMLNAYGQEIVVFKSGDGWELKGTLYLPQQSGNEPMPAVVLVTEPGVLDRTIYDQYLAQKLADAGFVALNFDLRGTGESLGKKIFEEFSIEEVDDLQLDIRAAIDFLAKKSAIDPNRIGVVGTGLSSKYAVREASERHPSIQALVLLSGELDDKAYEYFKYSHSVPVLSVVDKNDQEYFGFMTESYETSVNRSSDLILAHGHGAVMFSYSKGLEEEIIHWFEHNLMALGTEKEITFKSFDGWELHGTLRLPAAVSDKKVPGVVLVHGAKHDQLTYYQLARELTKQGMATFRFDWRGKGRSTSTKILDDQYRDIVYKDIEAAIEVLASQSRVDANSLGTVAATAACVYTLEASLGDARVKTVVLMTALEANARVKQLLAGSNTPIFAIASTDDYNYQIGASLAESTRQIYKLSNSKESSFLLYDDAGRGTEMLKIKRELEPMVIRWLNDKLQGISPTELHIH